MSLCSLFDSWNLEAAQRAPVMMVSSVHLYAYWCCFLRDLRTLSAVSKSMPYSMHPPLKWRSALCRSVWVYEWCRIFAKLCGVIV